MSNDVNPNASPQSLAHEGEAFRRQGNFSAAVVHFSRAIGKLKGGSALHTWALAHRGATHASMGDYRSARSDLKAALSAYEAANGQPYVWAVAQKAEVHRCWARDHLTEENMEQVYEQVTKAITWFDMAIAAGGDLNWAQGHKAAAHTLAYLVGRLAPSNAHVSDAFKARVAAEHEAHATKAHAAYKLATDEKVVYPWAEAFSALQLMLEGKFAAAERQIGQATLYDSTIFRNLLRYVTAMYAYDGRTAKAVQMGWLSLNDDPEDWFAHYFLAQSLYRQAKKSGNADLIDASKAVVKQARLSLLKTRGLIDHMLESLEDGVKAEGLSYDAKSSARMHGFEAVAVATQDSGGWNVIS